MRLAFWKHQHQWVETLRAGPPDFEYVERKCQSCGERDAYSHFTIPLSDFAPRPSTPQEEN